MATYALTPHPTSAQFSFAPWLEWAYLALGEHRIPGPRTTRSSWTFCAPSALGQPEMKRLGVLHLLTGVCSRQEFLDREMRLRARG
jgi:hypothetical protein